MRKGTTAHDSKTRENFGIRNTLTLFSLTLAVLVSATERSAAQTEIDLNELKPPAIPDSMNKGIYEGAVRRARRKLPPGFSLVAEKPWIVVGDGGERAVKASALQTVRWASKLLQKDYFPKDPTRVITIWLFKDKKSYEHHLKKHWQMEPGTPFGFYSAKYDALFMNISTGGGTLVHEMVHPLMESNFPACPSWFNEGLASLYEQCGEKKGKIMGKTNWRLGGLKTAIKKGTVPPFEKTMSTTTNGFYSQDPGTNYSQSRYLCYYLQERSLLRTYYKEFRKNSKNDPTGLKTLKKVLKLTDMKKFQKDWETWVSKLRFGFG